MELHIDVRWLLEQQARVLRPDELDVSDFSAFVAAVARHRVNTPRLDVTPDAAWRAAALLVTLIREESLPRANMIFACAVVIAYMHASGEGINPPYGALPDLAHAVRGYEADVYQAADLIRSWRV